MLLEKLIKMQRDENLTDQEMADRLHIPRSTWQNTRSGVRPMGRRVALAVKHHLPQFRAEAVSFLLSDAACVAASDVGVTTEVA